MGNGTSRVVGCFVPFSGKNGVDIEFLDPLDEGLGHSFCYVRPSIFESPAITPSNSERYTVDSSTLDSETLSGSFRHDMIDDPSGFHRPIKSIPETTFKTISGASVSANVSTARTGNQSALFSSDVQEPAASFDCTSSFAAIPLQPVPHCSGPLNGFMSGPLERGFASGPLERGGGFMSGPIEKGVMSGPLDTTDKSNFSAPLAHVHRRPGLQRLMRSVSGPMKSAFSRTFSKHSVGPGWMQRFFLHPVSQLAWHPKEPKFRPDASRNCPEGGPSEGEYRCTQNLQWAHGKAGEDRVQVVLSEEQGWLFIGIYDGFSGPDAPDFLMSHLYKAIDIELEGLLWDYEDKPLNDPLKPELHSTGNTELASELCKEDQLNPSSSGLSCSLEESCIPGIVRGQSSNFEIVEENEEVRISVEPNCEKPSISGIPATSVPIANLTGQGRKSMRLYELLQMEPWDGQDSMLISEVGNRKKVSRDCQSSQETLDSRETLQEDQVRSCVRGEDPTTSGEDQAVRVDSINHGAVTALSGSRQRQNTRKSLISSKIRKMYRKQKSLRKKLFPWSYDWHREETCVDERMIEPSGPIRRCKYGVIDHDAVLRAMARALERTEEAYMEMVEKAHDKNPELALMGSRCVCHEPGDSRVILAQERPNDRYPNPSFLKDDARHGNRSRESLVRMELDRISEDSPMHNQHSQVSKLNKNREISMCRLKMKAVQLSTDHSTSVEQVIAHVTWFMENVPEGDPAQYLIAELLFRAAKKNGMDFHELLDIPQGDRRKYHDDVSVMVVSLEGRIWRSSG
ncbi:protein phosphatase 2c 32 [Quercus suber]|uniref:Protein phosphatase 2c 32 n=1 Tax=Quercus suber TaxID=58331 RepID=A0AAW0KUB4_QUESU